MVVVAADDDRYARAQGQRRRVALAFDHTRHVALVGPHVDLEIGRRPLEPVATVARSPGQAGDAHRRVGGVNVELDQ